MRKPLVVDTDPTIDTFVDTVKWYRANIGTRGADWDFMGGLTRIEFYVYTEKAALMVLMWRSNTARRVS